MRTLCADKNTIEIILEPESHRNLIIIIIIIIYDKLTRVVDCTRVIYAFLFIIYIIIIFAALNLT